MISGPATHPVWLNWKANGSNGTGRACQAEICTLRAKKEALVKRNGHDHKLMKSSRFMDTMKTAWAAHKYPDRSIKRVIFAKQMNLTDFTGCAWTNGEKNHNIMVSADSGSIFISTCRQAIEKGGTYTWNTCSSPSKTSTAMQKNKFHFFSAQFVVQCLVTKHMFRSCCIVYSATYQNRRIIATSI